MARRISAPVLVGREAELALLTDALAEARSGRSRTVVIGGESGIGKSRLVAELTGAARAAGWSVHAGACPPGSAGAPVPFAPFGTVLRSLVRSVDARLLDHLLGGGRRDLAALLPELGEPDPAWSATGGAARLFESVLSLVERATRRGSGMVLVLEDLHWADASARALFAWLVQELRQSPVLLIATHRTDLDPGDPLPGLLVELDRADGCERIELGPLPPADADRLLLALAGEAVDGGLRAAVVRRAGGVPLYLEELVSAGAAADGPPASVRVAVARRLAGLDADALRLVQLAALAGRPVDVAALGILAGLQSDGATAGVTHATEAGLLRATGSGTAVTGPSQVIARHALIAEAVITQLPPGAGAAFHAAWARLLRDRPDLAPASPVERTAVLAHHLVAAGDRDAAVPALLAAAAAAIDARAFATADSDYAHALDLAGDRLAALMPDPVAVLDAAARAAWLAGRPTRAIGLVTAAMTAAPGTAGDDAALRRRTRLASYLVAAGRPAQAIEELETVVAAAPPGPTRIRALIELGRQRTAAGDADAGVQRCRMALEEARLAGDRRAATRAGIALGVALSAAGHQAEAAEALVEARRSDGGGMTGRSMAGGSVSRLPDTLARHVDEATLLLHLGDVEGSLEAALRAQRVASERGLTDAFGAIATATAAWDLIRLGRWPEADAILAAAAGEGTPMAGATAVVGAWLAAARGRWVTATAALEAVSAEALAGLPGASWPAIATAAATLAAAGQGRLREARDVLRTGLRTIDGVGAPATIAGLAVLGLAVEADAAELARGRGDAAALDDALDAAQELAARGRAAVAAASAADRSAADPAPAPAASAAWQSAVTARLDAELARASGADSGAAWERVIAADAATRDRWGGATARLHLATALLAAGTERTRATSALTEAIAVARELMADPLVAAIERLARRARIALPPDPATAAAAGPRGAALALGLSEREVDVLALLAQGRTDREIAEQLFITEKTAGHHVSHILTKLGVSRRGEAAAVAHRIGLVAGAA